MIVRELFARLGLDVDAQSFAKGELAASAVKKALTLMGDALVGAVRGVAGLVQDTIRAGSELNDLSAQTGINTDKLQALEYAGAQSGVRMDSMVTSIGHLQKQMYEATQGNKEASEAFAALGIDVTGADGKLRSASDVMEEMANKMPNLSSDGERVAVAMTLMSRGGKEMLKVLKPGDEGLAALQKRFQELGGGMTPEMVKALDKAGDTIDDVETVFKSIGNTIVSAVLPAFQEFLDTTLKWLVANRKVIAQRIEQVLRGVAKAFRVVVAVGRAFIAVAKAWKPILMAAAGALTVFAGIMLGKAAAALGLTLLELPLVAAAYGFMGLAAVKAALSAAAAWLVAIAPLALAALGVAFLIGLVEDIYQLFAGGQSIIGDFWAALWDTDTGFAIKEFFAWLGTTLRETWDTLGGFSGIWDTAIAAWKGVFTGFWEWLKSGFVSAVSALPGGGLLMSQLAGPTAQGLASGTAGAFGGGESPAATVASSSSASSVTNTSRFSAPITINAQPGQDANAIATAVRAQVRDELRTQNREAFAAAGGQ